MEDQVNTRRCREQVVRALALARALAALAEGTEACDHDPCALLGKQARQFAAELRRAAAHAGLYVAGLRLAHPSELYSVAQEPEAREVNDDVSSTTTK
jgi:hypothetical protein